MMGTAGPQESPGPLPAATPCSVPQQQEPSTEYVPGGHPGTTSRHPSPAGAALDQDRVAMPPAAPRPPQQRGAGPFDDAELRALYGIHASTPSSELVATLREHLRDVDPNRLFAVVPLLHAATTEIFVRQLQALVTPGAQVSDDLVEAWIWWFNTHQPTQGGVWVPHLGWVHTLIAPPTDPRPAPSTGGRERAAPRPRPDNLRIPPHAGLAAWESGTARSRGHMLTSLAAHHLETTRAAPPPRERDPGTIAMIVLENGHYYQVRIIRHPQRGHWSLEAVDSMLPATPLLTGQPPDPLRAVVSGTAGTWHPGHALYCLWRWARRRWPHTRAWSAAWRFYLDGRQQLEAIPERTAETPTATNLCPVFRSTRSGRWHWASNCSPPSALRRRPRRRKRPWCTKFSVPSAAPLCDAWVTPQGPGPQPATGPAAATRSRTRAAGVPRRPCARGETTCNGHACPG